jgi:hypothetical protein
MFWISRRAAKPPDFDVFFHLSQDIVKPVLCETELALELTTWFTESGQHRKSSGVLRE